MNTNRLITLAEQFLNSRNLRFARPGEIGEINDDCIEVIFMKPEALDPNVVVDPPDIRVLVNKKTGAVELIEQM